MEAFSDGVLAIAITLLVLDLSIDPPGSPLKQFLEGWPTYLAYLVSFLTIGAAWIDHNALTERLRGTDQILLRINLIFLMVVAFLPFPTALVAKSLHERLGPERVSTVVFGLTLLAIQLLLDGIDRYCRSRNLNLPGEVSSDLRSERRKFRWAVAGYASTIAVAMVVPDVAVALYLVIAAFLVIPFQAFTNGPAAP